MMWLVVGASTYLRNTRTYIVWNLGQDMLCKISHEIKSYPSWQLRRSWARNMLFGVADVYEVSGQLQDELSSGCEEVLPPSAL